MIFMVLLSTPAIAPGQLSPDELASQGGHIHALLYSSTTKEFLVGTHYGLFKSGDGKSWRRVADQLMGNTDVMGLRQNKAKPGVIFASGHDIGVYRSDDGGRSWAPSGKLPHNDVHALAWSPSHPDILYIFIVGYGLYKSQDMGRSWQSVNPNMARAPILSLAVSPKDPDIIYTGLEGRFLISRDGGRSWAILGTVPASTILSLLVESSNSFLAATDSGLFQSRDGGISWSRITHSLLRDHVVSIAYGPAGKIYGITYRGAISESSDSGGSWKRVN